MGMSSNDCEETEKETDTFYCNYCGVDDWFDCLCSNSENESQSDKKEMKVKKIHQKYFAISMRNVEPNSIGNKD